MDTHFLDNRPMFRFGAFGFLVALVLALVMYQTVSNYENSVVLERAQNDASLLVELTGGFVRTYSKYQARFSENRLPNPAVFRAEALAHIERGARDNGRVSTAVVGLPGREIAKVATDKAMRVQLQELEASPSTDVLSSVYDKDSRRTHRSLWAFFAQEQACADCHNRLQNLTGSQQWKVGDLMGAQIVEQDIHRQVINVKRTALIQSILLFAAVLAVWYYCLYLINHFRLTRELKTLATTDPLTGCLNRRELHDRLSGIKGPTNGALLMVDLDKFKSINDTYGHDAGDAVIRDFTERVQSSLRSDDWIARFGGEEFLVWAQGVKATDAIRIAERIRSETEQNSVRFGEFTIKYTVSIGMHIVANAPSTGFEGWIKAADKLVYRAKTEGRNRIVCEVGVTG